MMKKSSVIGKRQLLLALLVIALAVAVYLNWYFAKNNQSYNISDVMANSNIGEAVLVDAQADNSSKENSDFSNARSDRAKNREEELKKLKEIVDNPKSDSASVAAANEQIVKITTYSESENNIETLVKAKGFSDCAVVMNADSVSVMVKTDGLLASDTVQIQDIVVSETGYSLQNIKIVEIK